jgi:hypothetical protein
MQHLSRLLLALPIALIDFALAQSPFTPVSLPALDFSSLGEVSLGGDFQGISIYQYTGQTPSSGNLSGDAIYLELPNGELAQLGVARGSISSLCALNSALFLAGNFPSVGPVTALNIATYDLSTGTFSGLHDFDILGSVSSLYCDATSNLVYVGGSFQSGGSNNAIIWNPTAGHWQDLPFGGFDGPVNTIVPGTEGDILFGGVFDALGNGTGSLLDRMVINLVTANVFFVREVADSRLRVRIPRRRPG